VRKHGDAKKYNAHVIHVGHECDIAMVTITEVYSHNLLLLLLSYLPSQLFSNCLDL